MEVKINNEEKKEELKEEQKLSYEELNNVIAQQNAQLQRMAQELQQAGRRIYEQDLRNTLAELDLRIRLLEFEDVFSSSFIKENVSRIEETLTLKEEEVKEKEEEPEEE